MLGSECLGGKIQSVCSLGMCMLGSECLGGKIHCQSAVLGCACLEVSVGR